MSAKEDVGKYQRVYRDIINGYSCFHYSNDSIYLKHLSPLDLGNIQDRDEKLYASAKSDGLPTEKDQLKTIIDQELWSEKKEKEIAELEIEISRISGGLEKLIVKSQIKKQRLVLDSVAEKLNKLQQSRSELLGFTCEAYVRKKLNQEYLKYSLYSNESLKDRYLTEKVYNDISDQDLDAITSLYNEQVYAIQQEDIKKIAAHPFFLNTFLICQNDPLVFFGNPVCKLSNYQVDLFVNGQRFKSVLEQGKNPPSSLYENMQSVVDWYEAQLGVKKVIKSEGVDGGTIMGATREEMQNFMSGNAGDKEVVSLEDEVKKTGKKELDMADLLKIHGL